MMNLIWIKTLNPLESHPSMGRVGYDWLLSFDVQCDSNINFFFYFKLLLDIHAVHHYALLVCRIVDVLFAKHFVRSLAHV